MPKRKGWSGNVRCWWNPATRQEITCIGLHYDHSAAAEQLPELTVAELEQRFPDFEWDEPKSPYDLLLDMVDDETVEDMGRTPGVIAGWVVINADNEITTMPYMLAPDTQSALAAIRWMATNECTAMDHPDFAVEILIVGDDEVFSERFRFDGKRLVPIELQADCMPSGPGVG